MTEELGNELFFTLFPIFSGKTLWLFAYIKAKMNEKLYKNTEDCRKFHSTPCLFEERWYTKTVFGCGFSAIHCAKGYALKFFSDVAYISCSENKEKKLPSSF